jgi:glyoxylase-like metal-dependent hydrolase (beta-lactamase superfamily II)
MDTILPNLYATPPGSFSFAPTLAMRAFLLRRDEGNLLIYSAPTAADDAAAIERLGGVSRQYIGHWHEASVGGVEAVAAATGAPAYAHERDGEKAALEPFPEDPAGEDFALIPMPGHTPGATAFLWNSGEHRVLFTGDSIYLRDGEWVAAVLDSSDRDAYVESLERLRELDFDMLVPWAATSDRPAHAVTDREDARRRIGAIIERIRRGAVG